MRTSEPTIDEFGTMSWQFGNWTVRKFASGDTLYFECKGEPNADITISGEDICIINYDSGMERGSYDTPRYAVIPIDLIMLIVEHHKSLSSQREGARS